MKKVLMFATMAVLMSSCYTTSVYVGENATIGKSYKKVESVMNHHFIYGLVPGPKSKIKIENYLKEDQMDNYVVKTKTRFLDGFLSCITGGIYTPTYTIFYVPED